MKKNLLIIGCLLSIPLVNAQIINIPDANFKAYLVGNASINTSMDTEIQLGEATAFTGTINVFNMNIADLTGIEAFTSLTQLNCTDNDLTSLDVSNNTALTLLSCGTNQLTSLDVSNNTNLTSLICQFNAITSLDVSNNTNLGLFWCNVNQLAAIDVSMLPLLTSFSCASNNIITLDVSNNSILADLTCQNNDLTSLNVANGNNTNFTGFSAILNPSLTCIQVDDSLYSATNWTNIDAASSFNEDCSGACTINIPDVNFKAQLIFSTSINTNADTEIQCTEASAYTGTINVSSSSISDLTGIEAFTSLTGLNCSNNLLTSLDVSNNTSLTSLDCTLNQLTSLDVSNNTALTVLGCNQNQLTNLDVSGNTSLTLLSCAINQLISLNVNNGNNTNFTSFNATSNPNLTCIKVDNAAYSIANWTNIDVTASFNENCIAGIDNNKFVAVSIYPNPTSASLSIQTNEIIEKIFIYTLMGALVQTETKNTFSVERLASGTYLLQVQTTSRSNTVRFIKE